MSDDEEELFTPKEVAEKINVDPSLIRVYWREFQPFLEDNTRLTKEINGHRRYNAKALAVFYEIKRLLGQGYKYADIREEFNRRKEIDLGGPASVVEYENKKLLEKLNEKEREVVKKLLQMATHYEDLVLTVEKQSVALDDQGLELQALKQQVANLSEEIPDKVTKEWARVNLEILESKGKAGWLAIKLGIRNPDEEERQKERYRAIIGRDRKEIQLGQTTRLNEINKKELNYEVDGEIRE